MRKPIKRVKNAVTYVCFAITCWQAVLGYYGFVTDLIELRKSRRLKKNKI